MCFSTYPLARVVGRDIGITSTTKLEVPDTHLLGREVLVRLLFPILRKVPVVFVRLHFVIELLGGVRELAVYDCDGPVHLINAVSYLPISFFCTLPLPHTHAKVFV